MAKKYNGTINFASALRPTGAQPLDDRMVVQSLTDLMSVATFEANGASAAYNGMMVAVLEEQKVFMLIDAANLTNEKSWISVGSGNGSLSVNTLDEAKELATVDNRGQIIFVIEENATYVVTGAATVMKLAASTADSIDELVAALQSDINTLKGIVGAPASGETEATGLVKEVADLKADVEAIVIPEVPVQDVTVGGVSVLNKETGVAEITMPDVSVYETIANVNKVREDVSANTEAIKSLAGVVGKAAEGENEATGLVKAVAENAAAIETKVAKEDGKRLMTDAEGTKLAGIAEGAQVNVIEVVKVNGQALSVAAGDKSVDVIVPTAPVQGVAAEEKVLSLDGDKLKTTLTLAYVPATETDNAVLRLQGKDGAVVSSIDATAFVKDGMLEGAKLEGPKEGESGEKYLVLTFNTAAGKEDIRMDVSSLLDYYAAGDGLALDGKTFAIKLDATAESYLKVTTNGLAVADALWTKVDEKDSAILTSAQGYADTKKSEAITEATGYTDTAIANLELDKNYEKAGTAQGLIDGLELEKTYEKAGVAAGLLEDHEEAMVETLKGKANVGDSYLKAEADAKFVAKVEGERLMTTAEGSKLAGIAEGAQVNVIEAIKVNGVDATVAEGGKLAEVTVDGTKVLVGADIQGDVKNPETGEISKKTVYGSTTSLAAVLQGIQDSVSVAVSGGLTSVVGGNGIEVSAVASNKQTVSVKVSDAKGNMITADENGLYAAMYYDGDDAE